MDTESTIQQQNAELQRLRHHVVYLEDCLQRERAQHHSQEAVLRKLSRAVEQSSSTIVITDIDGCIEFVNPAFSEVTGYSREEVLGQNPRILKSGKVPPETYEQLWATITEGRVWEGEFINRTKNNEFYWEAVKISPIKDINDTITHYLAIKDDITEQKRVELELSRHQANLEKLVETRTAELTYINQQLQGEIQERTTVETKLRQRNHQLTHLNYISQIFASSLDLAEVLDIILEEMRTLFKITATSIWLLQPDTGELLCQQATKPYDEIIVGWRLAHGQGIAGVAAIKNESIIVPDATLDARHFLDIDKLTGLALRSIISIPLAVKGQVIGVLTLVDTTINRFIHEDLHLIEPIAAVAASAIENARLYTEAQHEIEERQQIEAMLQNTYENLKTLNDRMQQELAMAQKIQASLLPPPKPQWSTLDVICYSTPARQVGGDLYLYREFDMYARRATDDGNEIAGPDGRLPSKYALAVGDVSGKGMPAALLMGMSVVLLEAYARPTLRPSRLLAHLDRAIRPYTETTHQNCAMLYVELTPPPLVSLHQTTDEPEQWAAHIANAGCIAPVIKRHDGSVEWLDIGGLPLGIGLGASSGYNEVTVYLEAGDMLILTSDGVVEASNRQKTMFGFDRLEECIAHGPMDKAEAMLNHLKENLLAYLGDADPHDDLTIVVLQV